jgi:hypothetical protein
MARYTATVPSSRPANATFAYLADFSTTAEWDPGIARTSRLDDGPVGVGSRFLVVSRFLGRDVELTYEITEHDPGARRVVLRGENATTVSVDEIVVGEDARVTYDADLRLKGPGRLFDPVLGLLFGRLGDRAADGLRRTLSS